MPQTITEEAVRATVEEIAEENLVWRRAFRSLDASSINNSTMTVPKPDDVMAEPTAVAPGSEFPGTHEEYSEVNITREKYGFETDITLEDQMDNVFDLIASHVDGQAGKMAEFLDGKAYAELSGNLNADSPAGDANGTLSYDDILAGSEQLELDIFDPDIAITDPSGKSDLLTDPDFTRATDMGDDVVQNGQIGSVSGLDVFYSDTGDLGQNDAIIIDTDYYGYEATWTGITSDRYQRTEKQKDVIRTFTMKGWKAMDSDAAILVDG